MRPLVGWAAEPACAQDVPRALAQAVFEVRLQRRPSYLSSRTTTGAPTPTTTRRPCWTAGSSTPGSRRGASLLDGYTAALVAKAEALTVGDPAREDVALGPIIDRRQLERVHGIVTASVAAGAKLAAGGETWAPGTAPPS